MIPAYNKKRCAAFPFETGIHFRRKTDFFPEEDTTKSYSGFEPEPTRLQAEGHSLVNSFIKVGVLHIVRKAVCRCFRLPEVLYLNHYNTSEGHLLI
ncbi:poly polymerase [Trichonephila clavipes]|nr:poly polymerase [Trichonephila clavipes]